MQPHSRSKLSNHLHTGPNYQGPWAHDSHTTERQHTTGLMFKQPSKPYVKPAHIGIVVTWYAKPHTYINGYNMVTVVTTVALVAYNTIHDHGSGLSPNLTHTQMHIITMLSIIFGTYIKRNMRGHTSWAAFPKALPCPRRSWGRLLLSAKF